MSTRAPEWDYVDEVTGDTIEAYSRLPPEANRRGDSEYVDMLQRRLRPQFQPDHWDPLGNTDREELQQEMQHGPTTLGYEHLGAVPADLQLDSYAHLNTTRPVLPDTQLYANDVTPGDLMGDRYYGDPSVADLYEKGGMVHLKKYDDPHIHAGGRELLSKAFLMPSARHNLAHDANVPAKVTLRRESNIQPRAPQGTPLHDAHVPVVRPQSAPHKRTEAERLFMPRAAGHTVNEHVPADRPQSVSHKRTEAERLFMPRATGHPVNAMGLHPQPAAPRRIGQPLPQLSTSEWSGVYPINALKPEQAPPRRQVPTQPAMLRMRGYQDQLPHTQPMRPKVPPLRRHDAELQPLSHDPVSSSTWQAGRYTGGVVEAQRPRQTTPASDLSATWADSMFLRGPMMEKLDSKPHTELPVTPTHMIMGDSTYALEPVSMTPTFEQTSRAINRAEHLQRTSSRTTEFDTFHPVLTSEVPHIPNKERLDRTPMWNPSVDYRLETQTVTLDMESGYESGYISDAVSDRD